VDFGLRLQADAGGRSAFPDPGDAGRANGQLYRSRSRSGHIWDVKTGYWIRFGNPTYLLVYRYSPFGGQSGAWSPGPALRNTSIGTAAYFRRPPIRTSWPVLTLAQPESWLAGKLYNPGRCTDSDTSCHRNALLAKLSWRHPDR